MEQTGGRVNKKNNKQTKKIVYTILFLLHLFNVKTKNLEKSMAPCSREYSTLSKDLKLIKKFFVCALANFNIRNLVKKILQTLETKNNFTKLNRKFCRKLYDDQTFLFKIEFDSSRKIL